MAQFVAWFDLKDVSPSASRFDHKKLLWINAEHIKITPDEQLAALIKPRLAVRDIQRTRQTRSGRCGGAGERARAGPQPIGRRCVYFYEKSVPAEADVAKHWDDEAAARMLRFADKLEGLADWNAEAIHDLFQPFCEAEGIKMGKLGMPLRLAVAGTAKTPSVDAVLALIGKEEVARNASAADCETLTKGRLKSFQTAFVNTHPRIANCSDGLRGAAAGAASRWRLSASKQGSSWRTIMLSRRHSTLRCWLSLLLSG